MLNSTAATARLSREVIASEQSVASALVDATALMYSCALAARDNDAPAAQVQATFMRAQKLTSALLEARGEAARTHGALLEIYREVCGTEVPGGCEKVAEHGGDAAVA